jgi:membrane protein implicated in regulation of membrane protease activity
MRKHIILSFALLLVLAAALVAGADSKASDKQYHRMHGDIASLDSATQSFTVKHGGDVSTFKTNNSTKFRGAGKEITFADLQVGDDVRVSYTQEGSDKTAARVDVAHTKKP